MEFEKKTERKNKRFAARLKSSKGVKCMDVPGPYIVLCNVGQATGFGKEELMNILEDNVVNVAAPRFIPESGESFSFVQFGSTEDATVFVNACNGKVRARGTGTPIYMKFVEQVPDTDIVCSDEIPCGLTLLTDFITVEEEQTFLEMFDIAIDDDSNNLKNRQVRHYGYEFRYGSNDVDVNSPLVEKIPKECDILWRRLREGGVELETPDQLTVNKYQPGHGIPSHVDKHSPFGDTILALSLGSDVVMDWRHHLGKYVPLLVPQRSLLIMQAESRYDWQHGIASRTWDPVVERRAGGVVVVRRDAVERGVRLSLTFRRVRRGGGQGEGGAGAGAGPCACAFPALCDSARGAAPLDELGDAEAAQLEELHVHEVYEQIAGHFSATRRSVWPRVARFVRAAPAGARLLDLGAGNGKNLPRRSDLLQVACERAAALLQECRARAPHAQAVRGDVLRAPLADRCADRLLCVAVLHHFASASRRLQAMSTIARLLASGGRALVTVWARDQSRSNYVKPAARDPAGAARDLAGPGPETRGPLGLPVHRNRTPFQHADLLVPWQRRAAAAGPAPAPAPGPDITLLRYYHVFEEGELESLCVSAGLTVEESFYEEGNWGVVCLKQ